MVVWIEVYGDALSWEDELFCVEGGSAPAGSRPDEPCGH